VEKILRAAQVLIDEGIARYHCFPDADGGAGGGIGYTLWAVRRCAKAYNVPPWTLMDVPEDELAEEAEMLEVEDEIVKQIRESARE